MHEIPLQPADSNDSADSSNSSVTESVSDETAIEMLNVGGTKQTSERKVAEETLD